MSKDSYELVQTSSNGPISTDPLGWTWKDHIVVVGLLLAIFITTVMIVSYNLRILYEFNPGYRRDLVAEQAFCVEIDKQFVSSVYYWDAATLECRVVEREAKR